MTEDDLKDWQIDWLLDFVPAEMGLEILFSDMPQTDFGRIYIPDMEPLF